MRLTIACVVFFGASCASAQSAIPAGAELAQALDVDRSQIRNAACVGIEEEPTEFSCTFEHAQTNGDWAECATIVAIDGDHWISIDGGSHCGEHAHMNVTG